MLGRTPTFTELGVVSALWSEHCSYKHSRPVLRTLPTKAPWVLQGPGENAGVISIGDGLAVAFKIESHNHPSAVEPYQGAATGVGGILRDVFTMGARPIAMLNSLRFGSLDTPRVRYLVGGVVKGIGDYGNCMGVPTVAGDIMFDPAYEGNPLVNAMCVGLLCEDDLIRAKAEGIGNPIMAVGARTGRDGIHGASFASEDLSHENDAKRPRVQVGDPFTEKLLLEATLELIASGDCVAVQDMGAAGLTSSSAEMAERGDVGVVIDTTKVPQRETGMTPYEILLSESQERMLVVAKKGREDNVRAILAKWDLTAAVIGEVIAEPVYRVVEGDRIVAEFPGTRLVTDCPQYHPEAKESEVIIALRQRDVHLVAEKPEESDPMWTLTRLLESPTIASKEWIHRQYDSTVRTNTVVGPGGGDAAVLRVRGTTKALAVKTDCNGRYVYLDPRVGGRIAVAEAARNVACVGARPRAVTNCLNFGNPKRPEIFFQFREAVGGMGDACRALDTPVTGGNVSLYNESPLGAVYPTPTIGMVGLVDDVAKIARMAFADADDAIVLLGEPTDELGASEYLAWIHGIVAGAPPRCDLERERALIETLIETIGAGLVKSAHDCSEGGLAVALAECAVSDRDAMRGASVDLSAWALLPQRALLFGEAQGRAVVTTKHVAELLAVAARHGVPAQRIGTVCEAGEGLTIRIGDRRSHSTLAPLAAAYHEAIPRAMRRAPAETVTSDVAAGVAD
ncbi:MAG: phosphoribosylformylglycinamidine synthase subunit PurL [Gemmatimonadetes bacterium]|nr:phosphoribosylformylglycinamidine synthase subunit PurL [Gemmatimonadota bacterium]MBI3567101.1 phosphoribosylformylglycinamidine synthase subunit PurL [Gemmatimonadota bacterium]